MSENGNAAKKLEPGPDLEVVQGEVEVVAADEITSMLDEMARKNAEELAAAPEPAPAAETATAPADPAPIAASEMAAPQTEEAVPEAPAEPEAILETPAVSAEGEPSTIVDAAEPTAVSAAAPAPTPAPEPAAAEEPKVETGPAFTMEDVLKAASEASSFSVDEIRNFEMEEEEPENSGAAIPEGVEAAEMPSDEVPEERLAMMREAPEPAAEPTPRRHRRVEGEDSEEETTEARKRIVLQKLAFLSILPAKTLIAAGVGAALFAGFALWTQSRISKLESGMGSKAARLEKSAAELAQAVDAVQARLADFDRALPAKPTRGAADESHPPKSSGEKGGHGVAAPKLPPAKGSPGGHGKSASHSPGSAQHPASSGHAAAKPKPKAKPKPFVRDHYDANAQVEGFRSAKLLIARGGAKAKAPTRRVNPVRRTAARAKPAARSRIAVYLDGRRISP